MLACSAFAQIREELYKIAILDVWNGDFRDPCGNERPKYE